MNSDSLPPYARLFVREYSRRTSSVLGSMSIVYFAVVLLYELLSMQPKAYRVGGFRHTFSFGFWIRMCLGHLTLCWLAIERLKLMANPDGLLSAGHLQMLCKLMLHVVVFGYNYLVVYAEDVVTTLFYPEGKYGPPLIREQFALALTLLLVLTLNIALCVEYFSSTAFFEKKVAHWAKA